MRQRLIETKCPCIRFLLIIFVRERETPQAGADEVVYSSISEGDSEPHGGMMLAASSKE
jgi:hypothetical protein